MTIKRQPGGSPADERLVRACITMFREDPGRGRQGGTQRPARLEATLVPAGRQGRANVPVKLRPIQQHVIAWHDKADGAGRAGSRSPLRGSRPVLL